MLIRGDVIEEIETARKRTRDWLEYEFTLPVGGGKDAIHHAERNFVLNAGDGDARSGLSTEVSEDFLFEGYHGINALSAPQRANRTRAIGLAARRA
jgi:hypothetical protein